MARLVLVKLGGGLSYSRVQFDGVMRMDRADLLTALADSRLFSDELRGVPLSKCTVTVRASPSLRWSSAMEADCALELEGGETLGALAVGFGASSLSDNLFIHVQLPAGAGAGLEEPRAEHALLLQRVLHILEAQQRADARRDLERLFIDPVRHTSGSWASSRSPVPSERFDLKVATIDYYGLWASRDGGDSAQWTVHPMLSDTMRVDDGKPAPVPFRDAILSHVWPSKNSRETDELAALLGLPPGFSVEPRNFLILPKFFEAMFDGDNLLLLPRRGHPPSVAVRRNRVGGALPPGEQQQRLDAYCETAPSLYLPLAAAATPHVPWLRVLGWKALSAIRACGEEAGATAGAPDFFDLDVSIDADGMRPLAACGGGQGAREGRRGALPARVTCISFHGGHRGRSRAPRVYDAPGPRAWSPRGRHDHACMHACAAGARARRRPGLAGGPN